MTRKVVHSSNLALRFYRASGWSREILVQYLLKGDFVDTAIPRSHGGHGDSMEESYLILSVGSRLDMARLYTEQVDKVIRAFDDNPSLTDVEFMEQFNW